MSVLTSGETAPSTYTRLLLSDTPWLKSIIQEYSANFLKNTLTPSKSPLEDHEIEVAMDSPRKPFFLVVLPLFARISKQRLLITITEDENLSEHRADALKENKPSIKPELLSQAELSFERIVRASHEAWSQAEAEWFQQFFDAVSALGVFDGARLESLNDSARISQLRHALSKLKVALPQNLMGDISCADYLRLRLYVMSCNTKTQQISPDCDTYLEKLRPALDQIANHEDGLTKQLHAEIQDFLSKFKV